MLLATEAACQDIYLAAPDKGRPLRQFLAGGPPPIAVPLASCRSLVGMIMEQARVSKPTALASCRKVVRAHGGHGAECLEVLGPQFNPVWADVNS